MVTPKGFIEVKSDWHNSPGLCTWGKNTSRGGPCSARHIFTRRCRVLSCPSPNRPGYRRCKSSNSVLASRPGLISRFSSTPAQKSLNGSSRVRQKWSTLTSWGNLPRDRYLRAVFSSMSAFAAADAKLIPFPNSSISLLTSLSVTIQTSLSKSLDSLTFSPCEPGILIVVRREF